MKNKLLMLCALGLMVPVIGACSMLQKRAGDQIAGAVGYKIAEWAECSDPTKVVKWAKTQCASIALCSTPPTGPITGAFLKPLIREFVPKGVDWAKPEAWGFCKLSKPKASLIGALEGFVDAIPLNYNL